MRIFKRKSAFDPDEAAKVADGILSELRNSSYAELLSLCESDIRRTITGSRGSDYNVVVYGVMEPDGLLRVTAAVDSGGVSAFKPLVRSFLMRPDGSVL